MFVAQVHHLLGCSVLQLDVFSQSFNLPDFYGNRTFSFEPIAQTLILKFCIIEYVGTINIRLLHGSILTYNHFNHHSAAVFTQSHGCKIG